MASSSFRILCIALALFIVMKMSSATDYTVGDSGGWGLGSDYSTWASDKTFLVGDTLVFNYESDHSVAEVGSTDYNGCSTANALSSSSSGATTIQLKTAGTHYFVCGVSFHCSSGMKLAVTVKSSSSTTGSPVVTDSPPASAGTTITNTNTPASPHVPNSSSAMSIMSTIPSLLVVAIAYALLVITITPMP